MSDRILEKITVKALAELLSTQQSSYGGNGAVAQARLLGALALELRGLDRDGRPLGHMAKPATEVITAAEAAPQEVSDES